MGWQSNIHRTLTSVDVFWQVRIKVPYFKKVVRKLGKLVVAKDVGSVSDAMIPNESGFILDQIPNAFA